MYPYGVPVPYYPGGKPAEETPVIPEHVKRLAKEAGASHINAEGTRIYKTHYGKWLQSKFDGREADSWWPCEGLPGGAVEV